MWRPNVMTCHSSRSLESCLLCWIWSPFFFCCLQSTELWKVFRAVDYILGWVWTWLDLEAKLMIASSCIWLIFAVYYQHWVFHPFKTSNDWFDILTSYREHNLLLAPICINMWLSQIAKCWLIAWRCWLWWKIMAVNSTPALNVCRNFFLR